MLTGTIIVSPIQVEGGEDLHIYKVRYFTSHGSSSSLLGTVAPSGEKFATTASLPLLMIDVYATLEEYGCRKINFRRTDNV